MIIVRVELHSAITNQITELARMCIANNGTGDAKTSNYDGVTFRGRNKETLDKQSIVHKGEVKGYNRQQLHVWNLVAQMLRAMNYG